MTPREKELRQKRAKLTADVRAIKDKADKEKRSRTAEELDQSNKILDEIDTLSTEIRTLEEAREIEERADQRLAAAEEASRRNLGRQTDPGQPGTTPGSTRRQPQTAEQRAVATEEYREAFGSYLRRGMAGISEEHRNLLISNAQDVPQEVRDMGIATGAAGGFTVAPLFQAKMSDAMLLYQGVRQAGAEHITGSSGADLPFPANDDTANEAVIVAEAGDVTGGTDLVFTQTVVPTYMYTSRVVKLSLQLLQDGAFNLEQYLAGKLAMRMGRGTNTHWTTGTGTGQPRGIITALNAGAGIGVTCAAANAFTADELLQLQHSVDPEYRMAPGSKYGFSDTVLRIIRTLKDSQGRYLLNEPTQGAPATVWGKGFTIFTKMATTVTNNAVTAIFGDFSHYKTREVTGMGIVRLDQLYMPNLQVGFLAFGRFGGNFVNPGNFPIKCMKQAA